MAQRKTFMKIVVRPVSVQSQRGIYSIVAGVGDDERTITNVTTRGLANNIRVAISDAIHYFRQDNGLSGSVNRRGTKQIQRRQYIAQRGYVEEINPLDGTARDVVAGVTASQARDVIGAINTALWMFISDNGLSVD